MQELFFIQEIQFGKFDRTVELGAGMDARALLR